MPAVAVSLPSIDTPMIDRRTGMMTDEWYRWFEDMQRRTGGDIDAINASADQITLKANKDITINVGHGLEGGGDLNNNVEIAAKQDAGWTAGTGVGNKGAYAEYTGQTTSVGYVQAEAQATDDAVKAVSARLTSIEGALRNNEAIDG
jgi:hypothetical protein